MVATADNCVYRGVLLVSHCVSMFMAVYLFVWTRGHVYELHVQRAWYYFSTAGACCLTASDVYGLIVPHATTLEPSLAFGWCVLWIVHLGVDCLSEHGTRYPEALMAWLLGLHVARAGLLFPLVLARQYARDLAGTQPHTRIPQGSGGSMTFACLRSPTP